MPRMIHGVPFAPPIGAPLGTMYESVEAFNAAVSDYAGSEEVKLDAATVKEGTTPPLQYYEWPNGEVHDEEGPGP